MFQKVELTKLCPLSFIHGAMCKTFTQSAMFKALTIYTSGSIYRDCYIHKSCPVQRVKYTFT